MDSEDSRDAGDAHSSSSSSSSSSSRRSRRSSSSDRSDASKKNVNSPPHSPKSQGPRSPSPESPSQSSIQTTTSLSRPPRSPSNLSGAHSDINSPENSMPNSPSGPRSPEGHKSPSEVGSNIASPEYPGQYSSAPHSAGEGPKTPCSPSSSAKSAPNSPEPGSRPVSPDSASHIASSTSRKLRTGSQNSSRSPDRNSSQSPQSSSVKKSEWSPKEKWRRHTKAEQKMVPQTRERSGSESSQSSSSTYNKRNKDTATEEISEGEMESDQDDDKTRCKSTTSDKVEGKVHNMSHEDLSDVSDLDSIGPEESVKESKVRSPPASPESKQDASIYSNNVTSTHSSPKSSGEKMEIPKLDKVPQEKTSNTEDGEEQLDFEAEEGECVEPKTTEQTNGDTENKEIEREAVKAERRSRGSSLEEGEVSDEAERRPEESEPRPVCRFFSRGACTWGVSCRFLHPGVTDKGNYSMFEVIRGVPPGGSYPPPARDVAPPESAWERGLRTAKEMVRIANKRKEQDMDFEEKKLHLSVGGVVHDPDAELAYAAAAVGASPPPQHDAPPLPYRGDADMFRPPPYGALYRGRYPPRVPLDERERFFEHERGYERERERERFYERPPIYDERPPAPDDMPYHKRRVRPSREVIVQRAEVERREGREGRGREVREAREVREGREVREAREVREGREVREARDAREGREARDAREGRDGRGDEWADPWMRAEPAARRRRPVSSEDSYSSSSSSNSSSRSSRSPGARRKRRASSSSRQRLSPSVIVRERRLASARATAMNPPAPRRRAPSPAAARLAANPPPPANHAHVAHRHKEELDMYGRTKPANRGRDRKYSRSSSSGSESSSSSSESESESRSSSTSGSSGARRARHARLLNAAARPRLSAKSSAGLAAAVSTAPSKKEAPVEKEVTQARKRPATSPVNAAPAKKSVSRREELLKQLKAVEDAIARKRSKI